jgi:hypothetical protein
MDFFKDNNFKSAAQVETVGTRSEFRHPVRSIKSGDYLTTSSSFVSSCLHLLANCDGDAQKSSEIDYQEAH